MFVPNSNNFDTIVVTKIEIHTTKQQARQIP